MKKKLSTKKIILTSILVVIVLIISSISIYGYSLSSKINRVEVDRADIVDTGKEPLQEASNIITIALFGTDYMGNEIGASDSTMILAIDKKNKELKLCSLMRDMYLDLPDGGKQNLNYTMSDGGHNLILKTMNYNFNLQIDKFVQIDLHNLPKVIDKLGGVELDIASDELDYINSYIVHIDKQNDTATPLLSYTGKQNLNGTQATAYCRVRYTEGRDFKRTERQRDVLIALFDKVKNISITEVTSIISDLLPLVSTNMSNTEMLSIASDVLDIGASTIEQARFPEDGDFTTEWTDMYHMITDIPLTTEKIHNFLFN